MLLTFLIVVSLAFVTGCNKSEKNEKATLQVMLTDAPAEYDQVLIDIQASQNGE